MIPDDVGQPRLLSPGSTAVHAGVRDPTPADRLLVEANRWGSRLRFPVMPLFFRAQGRDTRPARFPGSNVADAEDLGAWLCDIVAAKAWDVARLTADAEARCRVLHVEPPTFSRVAQIVRGALRAYGNRRHAARPWPSSITRRRGGWISLTPLPPGRRRSTPRPRKPR